jgi:hypothetical protein
MDKSETIKSAQNVKKRKQRKKVKKCENKVGKKVKKKQNGGKQWKKK